MTLANEISRIIEGIESVRKRIAELERIRYNEWIDQAFIGLCAFGSTELIHFHRDVVISAIDDNIKTAKYELNGRLRELSDAVNNEISGMDDKRETALARLIYSKERFGEAS